MTTPVVTTHQLSKHYGDIVAVDRVDLSVGAGEVYGFLGPNGAGKTTTLRMLLGLVRPTSGSATVLGEPIGSPRHLSRLGALIEGPAFYPYLSGRANLVVLARHARVPVARVETALRRVDLTDRGGDRYRTYSLGMKQRLGVAAALLKEPRLLILDEPTNGLDPAGMADMRLLVRRLGSDGCTVLLSSHLLGEVQQICDRVGVIAGGRLLTAGTVAELRGTRRLRVEASPPDRAETIAAGLLGTERVRRDGAALDLDAGPDEAAALNTALVTAGVAVSQLRTEERDLEDVFLTMTRKGQSDVE